MQDILFSLIDGLKSVLPTSPFAEWLEQVEQLPYLSWLNWFFPVGACLKVMWTWLVVVGLFYGYSIVMRWLKVIGD